MSTVLLIEDSLTESEMLTRYLRQAGFFVIGVKSGEEAQERLNRQKPDLIVLDVILPGQSGFELCRELKANQDTKAIPIVMYSSKNTGADKIWGNLLGADAYLFKPVDQQELLQTVQRLAGKTA